MVGSVKHRLPPCSRESGVHTWDTAATLLQDFDEARDLYHRSLSIVDKERHFGGLVQIIVQMELTEHYSHEAQMFYGDLKQVRVHV